MTTAARSNPLAQDERRAAILRAAAEIFFDQGYAATSIDALIERVGGSKRNIYSEFGSKEGLFTALVSESSDAVLSVEWLEGQDLRETLHAFGRQLLAIYMSPTGIGIYRSIMAEALRFPHLAQAFYDKGPRRASDRLVEVLEEARARGEVAIDDCRTAADHFLAMLRDNLHLRVVLGLRPPPSPAETEAALRAAVDILLHGISGRD